MPRLVRIRHTADTSFLGLTAARLSGSGYAIGIQAKGTAVIHRADRLPHMNIELFSNAPVTTLDHYRAMGRNAALLCARAQRRSRSSCPSTARRSARAITCASPCSMRSRRGWWCRKRRRSTSNSPSASEGPRHDISARPLSAFRECPRTGRVGLRHAARRPDARCCRVAAQSAPATSGSRRTCCDCRRASRARPAATGWRSTSSARPNSWRSRRT